MCLISPEYNFWVNLHITLAASRIGCNIRRAVAVSAGQRPMPGDELNSGEQTSEDETVFPLSRHILQSTPDIGSANQSRLLVWFSSDEPESDGPHETLLDSA
ncbi:unnamed protein product [Boreogadus saida]